MVGGHDDGTEQAAALAAMGLKADAPLVEDKLELWSDNVAAVEIFGDMLTQWNVGPGGLVGLRYEALPNLPRYARIPDAEKQSLFDDLRVMERAAITEMRKEQ